MTGVRLRFASNTIAVPEEDVDDLVRRIAEMPNGKDGADELREQRRFADDEQKHLALSTIEAWMQEPGTTLPGGIDDVRYELMRDLRLPPFDT